MVVAKAAELQILIPEGVAQVPPHFTPILSPFSSILSHKMDVLSWLTNRSSFLHFIHFRQWFFPGFLAVLPGILALTWSFWFWQALSKRIEKLPKAKAFVKHFVGRSAQDRMAKPSVTRRLQQRTQTTMLRQVTETILPLAAAIFISREHSTAPCGSHSFYEDHPSNPSN
eukprot:COSAG04_NODE_3246_length_3009_cov_13.038288_2_plen_170_part_00